MNVKFVSKLGVMALAFCSLQTMAQTGPRIVVGTGSGQVGSATPVVISVDYDGDGTVAAFQVDVTYDAANLTADLSSCGGPLGGANFTCTDIGPGAIRFLGDDAQLNPLPSGSLGSISFDISSAVIADYDLLVPPSDEIYSNNVGDNVPSTGSTPGLVQVTAGPQPDWSSIPDSATGLDWFNKVVDTGAYELSLQVTNTGAVGSTLTGTCQVSGSAVFSIVGDNTLGAGLEKNASQSITVACDTTSATLVLHQGTLSCEHNGDGTTETSITDYALSCNITEGPQPAFSGTPNGLDSMSVPEEGDTPEPRGTLSVENDGNPGTDLSGSCIAEGAHAGKFTVDMGTFINLDPLDPAQDVIVTCDTSEEGIWDQAMLACTYEAAGSPTNYPLSCTVGPPGNAEFGSTIAPAVGAEINIDLTPGGVLVDTVVAPIPLNISNDALEDDDRDLPFDCSYSGSIEISVGNMSGSPLAPMTSAGGVSFSCDTSAVGSYTGTYTCTYSEDGGETDQMADWNVSCEVRDPESDVDPSPASGDPRPINVAPGGTGTTFVSFSEVLDEGEPGSLVSCVLVDNIAFTIISSTAYPIEIPSGGTVVVDIEGTDTGTPADNTATLECFYADSGGAERFASWPLLITVQVVAIPTMGAWGQILMILSLLGIGMIGFRRFS